MADPAANMEFPFLPRRGSSATTNIYCLIASGRSRRTGGATLSTAKSTWWANNHLARRGPDPPAPAMGGAACAPVGARPSGRFIIQSTDAKDLPVGVGTRRERLALPPVLIFNGTLFRLRALVRDAFRNLGQLFVGVGFFLFGLPEELQRFVVAHLLSPGAERAVAGDFVMLDFLAGGNDPGVQRGGIFLFFHDVIAFGDESLHGFARFAFEGFIQRFGDLFQSGNVFLGFFEMFFEGLAQFVGLRGLRQFRQGLG